MNRLRAAEGIAHEWIQGAVPRVVSDQTDIIIKEIQRMKKEYPNNIIKRLGLRAVAYCYVVISVSLDKTLLAFFHYLDKKHTGSINGDGLKMLVPNYPEAELEGTLSY